MVQRCTSRQRSIPLSREGPNGGKGGSGIRVPVSPIRRGFAPGFVNNKKGALAAASDKVYQLLAQGRWFSPGTPASSTTKTGRHDIAEILLNVVLNTKIQSQIQIRINRTHLKLSLYTNCQIVRAERNSILLICISITFM